MKIFKRKREQEQHKCNLLRMVRWGVVCNDEDVPMYGITENVCIRCGKKHYRELHGSYFNAFVLAFGESKREDLLFYKGGEIHEGN